MTLCISTIFSTSIKVLFVLMLLDFISGLLKGIKNKNLRSAFMHTGIIKKSAIVLSIIFSFTLDIVINNGDPIFRTMMTFLAVGNESLSIIENLTALGVPFPKSITDRLHAFTELDKKKEEDL